PSDWTDKIFTNLIQPTGINGKIQDEIVDYLIGEEYRKPVIDYMKAVKSMYDEGLIDRQNIADYFNQLKIS
ncbi:MULTISPECIES: hypothetical protein, partial [Bacteroidaceae]|uniref:hypothetical protein n=1 Tax=Bacteroidaceae TaxID=815 RepID=UPI00258A22F8